MKKLLIVMGIFLLLLFTPFLIWSISSSEKLNVVILDKTVPTESMREHSGLVWLLNHYRYHKDNGDFYVAGEDYYGFKPIEHEQDYEISPLPTSLEGTDVIYIADTYGVYHDDLPWTEDTRGEHSSLIYGGLEMEEWQTIKDYALSNPTTLIAEFNTFASPTEQMVREDVTDFFHLDWTGWTGRYFENLSRDNEEIPIWIIERHENLAGEPWQHEGSGFVLVHDWSEDIVVLSEQLGHLGSGGINLSFTETGQSLLNLSTSPSYRYWFDIVVPFNEQEVLAYYNWDVTNEGIDVLLQKQIPSEFAAVLHHEKNDSNIFYFAGDFVDVDEKPLFTRYAGFAKWKSWTSFEALFPDTSFFWKTYVPMMKEILAIEKLDPNSMPEQSYPKTGAASYSARIEQSMFEVYKDNEWKSLPIKGVNMGMGKPGHFPGEAAISESEYYRWFEMIGEMNANTIRVYTLHPPGFYRALKRYNEEHDNPLYLFHGVWFDEELLHENGGDAYNSELLEQFETEWKNIVNAIHGQANIQHVRGHAHGAYYADISPYVIGWINGIEWDPEMVSNMSIDYHDHDDYDGQYIKTINGEPMEQWLAWQLDELMTYEQENYQWMRPVSFTNWVTTDLLEHPAEPQYFEDLATVDPNLLALKGEAAEVGMFASYHIYPYYPDFLNLEENYTEFIDHRGEPNNYAGYLRDLHDHHDLPILVAEFGVPSSRGLTHENPFGWNQGFLTEKEQGEIVSHLYEDIIQEGLLGGLVFTWQDEWFKRTWNTMYYDDPNRRQYWSNAQTNEQQFGFLSFDRLKIKVDGEDDDWEGTNPIFEKTGEPISKIFVDSDERYMYMRVDFSENVSWSNHRPIILLDSHPEQGNDEIDFLPTVKPPFSNIDFVLDLKNKDESRLLVDAYYDTFYFHYGVYHQMLDDHTPPTKNSGNFNPIELAISLEMERPDTGELLPFVSYEAGKFRFGNGNPTSNEYDSLADFYYSDETGILELRIPWALLNIKDPSIREIIGDVYQENQNQNIQDLFQSSSLIIDGINIAFLLLDDQDELLYSYPEAGQNMHLFEWEAWGNEPKYEERLKQSYFIVQQLFDSIE
ncbi:hypothetical protein JCM9140_1467 [Halalkalibacter wakoensis JCM 9140]|uniref:Uncharacterized protein n=1 Tax=Halalkalibacter wakoensis JCM 9140 TaxID=1236970 RepID=W4Q0K9_9BACI|nr:hypothetical protein [Halalkalibacter wakoensis]GAE25470.1 hypothetical protein JCM9140_1467 [Halalkalibacter wakoensis JCM 9140]